MFPFGQSVTIIRSGQRNRDGDREPESRHVIDGVGFSPASGVVGVDGVGRDAQTATSARLYAPFDADIRAGDRVVVDGVEYRVVGSPRKRRFVYSGRGAGLSVTLEEVAASGSTL